MIFFQMNTWGVFIGLMVGTLLSLRFGIAGLMLGIYLGNKLDEAILRQQQQQSTRKRQFWNKQTVALAFQLFGHLAKIDGKVSAQSIHIIESSLDTFGLGKILRTLAKQSFNQGKAHDFNYYRTIQQLQIALMMRPNLKNAIANIAIKLVETDASASTRKKHRLAEILRSLGIIQFNAHWGQQQYHYHSQQRFHASPMQNIQWAYNVLGITPQTSMPEVKRKYRKLLSDNHPDRLHAKGKPSEAAIKHANEKTIDIKKAYEMIKAKHETQTA